MKSIINQVFDITKIIEQNSHRQEIIDNYEQMRKNENVHGSIEYLGRRQYKQFLGFLLVNDQKGKINSNSPLKIKELDSKIIDSFIYAHSIIRNINRKCLSPLNNLIPEAFKIVDPYWEYDSKDKFLKDICLNDDIVDEFLNSYHNSIMYDIVKKHLSYIPKLRDMKKEHIFTGMKTFKQKIIESGFEKCPDEIFKLFLRMKSKSPDTILSGLFLILIYINSSLKNIDQILYQSFLVSKLERLDLDNIYNLSGKGSNSLSSYYKLSTFQVLPEAGEVVILVLPNDKADAKMQKEFCRIENVSMKFSQDFGNEFNLGLRVLDENVSAFGNILKSINV